MTMTPVEEDEDVPLWLSPWPFREPRWPAPPPADDED